MRFESLFQYQKPVVKFLRNSYQKKRLVQTYLFEGAKGTYQLEAAVFLANLLLCESEEQRPCFICEQCRRIEKNVHPRIVVISPEKDSIKKEQVEELLHEFSMTSLEDGIRVFIIDQIDKATPSAANSLLKFLEETNMNVYGILITQKIQHVIPTIVSRSVVVSFTKIPKDAFVEKMVEDGIKEEIAKALYVLTNSMEEAKKLLEDPLVVSMMEFVKTLGEAIENKEIHPSILIATDGQFLMKEPSRKYHHMFLNLLISFTNDKLYHALQQHHSFTFASSMDAIKEQIDQNPTRYIEEMEKILKAKDRLQANVNIELLYHQMLLEIVR